METIDLKALANKVLQRNQQGNFMETKSFSDRKLETEKVSTITPEQLESFEERAGIMHYDGGLSKEDAEKFAWCLHVCMLTENMSKLCERVKPAPCPRYQKEDFERWKTKIHRI